ncbi:hypothetical protein L2D01_05435 [Hyphomonadaceae bacterium ML37]|nr:hypothetical protein L2D01_05435 [Hyphomonadaceae bacterium ML37]
MQLWPEPVLLYNDETTEALVVLPEGDWEVFASTKQAHPWEQTICPSGLIVAFHAEFQALTVNLPLPDGWRHWPIEYRSAEEPEAHFAVDEILAPPSVRIVAGASIAGEFWDTDRFEPVRLKDREFLAICERSGDQHVFRVPIFLDESRPMDPLERWPYISEDEDEERTKLDASVRDDRIAKPKIGAEALWTPSPYRLTASEAKRGLRAAREHFEEAFIAIETALRIGATQLALDERRDEARMVMAALDGLKWASMAREVQAHRLGIYGKLSELAEREWGQFQQSRGGRKKGPKEDEAASLAQFDKCVLNAAQELIGRSEAQRVMKSAVAQKAARMDGRTGPVDGAFQKRVSRSLDRMIVQGRLPKQAFQARRKTDT